MLDNWRVLGRDTDSHTHIGLQRVIIGSRPTRILDIDSYQPLYKVFTVKVPWPTSLTSSLSCHFFVRRRLYFCMYFRDPEAFQAVLWIQRWSKEPAYRWDTLIPANCHTFGVFLPYYIMTFMQRKNCDDFWLPGVVSFPTISWYEWFRSDNFQPLLFLNLLHQPQTWFSPFLLVKQRGTVVLTLMSFTDQYNKFHMRWVIHILYKLGKSPT